MKNVLLLGGPADGQRVEVHGTTTSYRYTDMHGATGSYRVVPLCSHGEVHWFGVLDGADPLALLIAGYAAPITRMTGLRGGEDSATVPTPPDREIVWAPTPAPIGVGMRPPSQYGTGSVKTGDDK